MKYPLIVVAALLIGSCFEPQDRVLTMYPFYTDQTRTFDPAILGTWENGGDNGELVFETQGDTSYSLTWNICDASLAFDAHMVRLGRRTFLDLYPDTDALDALFDYDSSGLNLAQYYHFSRMIPLHGIYRVALTDTSFHMAVVCGDGLRTLIQKKKLRTSLHSSASAARMMPSSFSASAF